MEGAGPAERDLPRHARVVLLASPPRRAAGSGGVRQMYTGAFEDGASTLDL